MESRLVLNEAYFGKTAEVLKIEKAIQAYRNKYNADNDIFNTELATCNLREDLEHAIENAFGFEIVDLNIIASNFLNAYTYPLGVALDANVSKNLIINSKNGFKYKKEAGFCLCVYIASGLLLHPKFTAGEITAILLHEIGHNFTPAVFNHQGIFQKILGILELGQSIISFDVRGGLRFVNSANSAFLKHVKNSKVLTELVASYNSITGIFGDAGKFINFITMLFMNPITLALNALGSTLAGLMNPIAIAMLFTRNTDENFADSFPTMYGYGEEISSALAKLEPNQNPITSFLQKIPMLSNLFYVTLIPVNFMCKMFDEHSECCVRSIKVLDLLEHEIQNGNHSPKFKKRLKHDIEQVKKSINKYYYDSQDSDPEYTRKLYSQFLLSNKFYKIYSAVFNRATPDNIDKNIKEKMGPIEKLKFK